MPWTSVEALQRLTNRFKLQSYPINYSTALWLPPQVVPVTSIDNLLRTPKMQERNSSVTANGKYSALLVPTGKRWWVYMIHAKKHAGDTFDWNELYYRDADYPTVDMAISVLAANVEEQVFEFSSPVPMDAGDRVLVDVENIGGGPPYQLECQALIEEEDAYY